VNFAFFPEKFKKSKKKMNPSKDLMANEANAISALIASVSCAFQLPRHLLETPVELPCNQYACLSCIQNKIKNDHGNQLRCTYCDNIHVIDEQFYQNNAHKNSSIVNKILSNADRIHNYYLNDLEKEFENIKGNFKCNMVNKNIIKYSENISYI
jgi:hypothetical protein